MFRAAAIKRTIFYTIFDLPLVIFTVSAAVGIWAAYDRQAAWIRFSWIAAAVLLYYLLAGRSRPGLWRVAGLIILFAFLLAAYFLMTYDWQSNPVKIGFVNRAALGWMSIRPAVPAPAPDADITAGILAVLAPILLAVLLHSLHSFQERVLWPLAGSLLAAGAVLSAIFLSAERGPWIALAAAGAVWLWWWGSAALTRYLSWPRKALFAAGLGLALGLALVLAARYPGGLAALANRLPGPAEAGSRVQLWHNTLKLIEDYPYTGGGLASFPGLYSQVILVIPSEYLDNSHNLFLQVALEQGVLGLLALVAILAGSIALVLAEPAPGSGDDLSLLRGATLAALLVVILHGLIENALYGTPDALFLFLAPGLAVAARPLPAARPEPAGWTGRRVAGPAIIALFVLAGLGFFPRQQLARLYANLGAVKLARIELTGFPTGKWDEGRSAATLAPAEDLLQHALLLNAQDRTAQHHLGLVYLAQRDFPAAVAHLQAAYQADGADPIRSHYGIRKNLAYSYVWAGDVERAVPLLLKLPEARREMVIYTNWWQQRGRADLAQLARQAHQKIVENSSNGG